MNANGNGRNLRMRRGRYDNEIACPDCKQRRTRRCYCLLIACILGILVVAVGFGILFGSAMIRPKSESTDDVVVVKTSLGDIRGRVVSAPLGGVTDVTVDQYLGIPFALPPVGELRYADPVSLSRFPLDPYEATTMGNSCIQNIDKTYGDFIGLDMWNAKTPLSEDCLYLNIWVPRQTAAAKATSSSTKSQKAVMVWIFGGGFYSGTNTLWLYDGKSLAAFGDVIVVSVAYRVGTFGFLSTGDGRIKGNFGLKDQELALRWIKQHISSFGGDPDRITVFGESAGAASIGFQQLSATGSSSTFTRSIYQSGSPGSQWAFMNESDARQRSDKFFEAVSCSSTLDSEALLACLRKLDPFFIRDNEWVTSDFVVFPWVPTVDGEFLTDTPYNLISQGRYQHKDALLGVNADEGTFWILFALPGFTKDGPSLQNLTMFRNGVDIICWDLDEQQRDELKTLYQPGDGSDQAANRDALDKVSGDRAFTCPTIELNKAFDDAGIHTYFYHLSHRASTEVWPAWMGVIHGADIQWVFGMPMNLSMHYTSGDIEFTKVIMGYWTNFAKTGDPNGDGLPSWPEFSVSARRHLEFGGPFNFTVRNTLRAYDYCDDWRSINQQLRET